MSKTYAHERKERYADEDELFVRDEGRKRPRHGERNARKGDQRRAKAVMRPDPPEPDEFDAEPRRRHGVRW